MKVYRNSTEITRKDKLGRRLSFTGLGILFVGMLASFIPTWYPPDQPAPVGAIANFLFHYWPFLSFAALPLGFLTASAGSYFINRFASRYWPGSKFRERPDEFFERNLKGMDDKHLYFSYSLPTSYVMAGTFGLIQFAVRSDRGRVTVNGDKWREPFSLLRFLTVFAREGVGDPTAELQQQEAQLRAFLKKAQNGAEGEKLDEMPISNAVVFLNEQVKLDLTNPTLPVLRADQIKDYLRRRAKEVKISSGTFKALSKALEENANYQSTTENE